MPQFQKKADSREMGDKHFREHQTVGLFTVLGNRKSLEDNVGIPKYICEDFMKAILEEKKKTKEIG